jgi:hypothetical protein
MRNDRGFAQVLGVGLCAVSLLLAGCSGSSNSGSSDEAAASAPAATDPPAVEAGDDPAMIALCDQMVAEGLSPGDATTLAEQNGYVARVGTIDGEPQAVTMDYRLDRFTFEVAEGVVVDCQYG